ncbi:MAG TPA: hypothetical protein VJN18_14780 [Polyangiaceae bacterium]|nr:hypothetical protein [Polyangiaceae bacterium]
MNHFEAETLQTMLTGGLSIEHTDPAGHLYCTIEGAIAHIAAAQLRAVRFAMLNGDCPGDDMQEEGRGWCTTDKFTRLDAVTCLGATMALLQDSHYIAERIRTVLSQPEGGESKLKPVEGESEAAE